MKQEQRGGNDDLEFDDDFRDRDDDSMEVDQNVKQTGRFGAAADDPYKFEDAEAKDMQGGLVNSNMFRSPE